MLRNASVQLTISKGRITSLLDVKLGYVRVVGRGASLLLMFLVYGSRELIAQGSTGGLVIFEDRPNYWDAWGMSVSFPWFHVASMDPAS